MKRVVILILTLTFLAVLYYAYTTTANCSVDVTKKEGFTSAAPTRASDCNCLPGYIPSKDAGGKYGGNILKYKSDGYSPKYYYNPSGTKDVYLISSDNKCGLPTSGDFTIITSEDFMSGKYINKWGHMYDACEEFQKNKNTQETFFCQRLGDPSSRRECY